MVLRRSHIGRGYQSSSIERHQTTVMTPIRCYNPCHIIPTPARHVVKAKRQPNAPRLAFTDTKNGMELVDLIEASSRLSISLDPDRARSSSDRHVNAFQVFIGSSSLRSEHSRSRELLGLGITEAREHSITVDTNLEPDTPYRSALV